MQAWFKPHLFICHANACIGRKLLDVRFTGGARGGLAADQGVWCGNSPGSYASQVSSAECLSDKHFPFFLKIKKTSQANAVCSDFKLQSHELLPPYAKLSTVTGHRAKRVNALLKSVSVDTQQIFFRCTMMPSSNAITTSHFEQNH